ncbi:hypothetical protein [Pedobacter sp. V48]|uniref:hypothetical protein n=1 Tax=Pedobacter sp. V48 TaxID=509635 RepID=UPI0003E49E72|nr:hypothetical protein [Pedobacter sp. V48]ETZ22947.1 hypothetical protein N824_21905 [Pedobacter sp. V48]
MKFNHNAILGLSAVLLFQLCLSSCTKPSEDYYDDVPYAPRPITGTSGKYISKIFEYSPAPGQFINTGFGTMEATKQIVGQAYNSLVSLGGYGGYIVFGFDHSIENISGADFGVYGNPLYGENVEWSEPGIVMVMRDSNGNGLPDDGEWLELAGSEYSKSATIKNYSITYYNPKNLKDDIHWKDNQGKEGDILRNMFNSNNYYPEWVKNQDQLTFTGTLLENTLMDGDIITNKPLQWGYVDNGSEDFKLLTETTDPYNSFDLDWAVDKSGNKVNLKYIDFVKIYTAQNSNGNPYEPDRENDRARWLGEISTEIGGAVDLKLHLKK